MFGGTIGSYDVLVQVSEEEVAAGLGPEWPSARLLADLQQQAIALSFEACQRSLAQNARAMRLCRTLLAILASSRWLQAAQGIRLDPAMTERLRDAQTRMTEALHQQSA